MRQGFLGKQAAALHPRCMPACISRFNRICVIAFGSEMPSECRKISTTTNFKRDQSLAA